MKIKLTALGATICFAALLVASTCAQTPRIIGFPTLDLDADIVEFDLASQTSKSLIKNTHVSTFDDTRLWATSDPATKSVFFHAAPPPDRLSIGLYRASLTKQSLSGVTLSSGEDIVTAQAIVDNRTGLVYDLFTKRVAKDKTIVSLALVDFDLRKLKTIRSYTDWTSCDFTVYDEDNGKIISVVTFVQAPPAVVSIDPATGDYENLPFYKIDRLHNTLFFLYAAMHPQTRNISLLAYDSAKMFNSQRNYTIMTWNPVTGDIAKAGPFFLFPPKSVFEGDAVFISATSDLRTGSIFASFSDLVDSTTTVIIEIDPLTAKIVRLSKFTGDAYSPEPRQLTAL